MNETAKKRLCAAYYQVYFIKILALKLKDYINKLKKKNRKYNEEKHLYRKFYYFSLCLPSK